MRFTVLLPLAFSLVAMVLAFLALFAGHKEGFMEDYDIVRLNMSTFGHDLIPSATQDDPAQPTETDRSIFDGIEDIFDDLSDDIRDTLNDIGNDIADKLAKELGISQWYSLHLMDACEGNFAPNATAPGAWFNVSNCTDQSPGYRINLTAILDHELEAGPLQLNLNQLPWPKEIQEAIDQVNQLLLVIFVFYCLSIGFSGLGILGSLAAFFSFSRMLVLVNFAIALMAAVALFVGSLVTTIGSRKAASEISDKGKEAGVSATAGGKFTTISWVAFAMMAAATVYWFAEFFVERRARKRVWTEKKHRGSH